LDFVSRTSFNFKEITVLRPFVFLGETVSVPEGVPNPWARLGEGSVLLALIFVADAAVGLWRRGGARERRRAVVVGGSILFCISAAMINALLIHTGVFPMPYFVSLWFVVIVIAMGYELSMGIRKGSRAYILDDVEGNSWVMKSASLIKDPNQRFENLKGLG